MSEPFNRSIRATHEDWIAFRRFALALEKQRGGGRIPQGEVLRIAVSSASALLASGQPLHGLQPEPRPPDKP